MLQKAGDAVITQQQATFTGFKYLHELIIRFGHNDKYMNQKNFYHVTSEIVLIENETSLDFKY